jgi:hypothetical protein
LLLNEGSKTPCDENGHYEMELPEWADHEKIARFVKIYFKKIHYYVAISEVKSSFAKMFLRLSSIFGSD